MLRCNKLAKPRPCVDRDSATRPVCRQAGGQGVLLLSLSRQAFLQLRRVRSREAGPAPIRFRGTVSALVGVWKFSYFT